MSDLVADLPPLAVTERVERLRGLLADAGCDALVVTDLINVRYLTGFTGSNGLLLVTDDRMVLATDGRYRGQSVEQLAASGVAAEIEIADDLGKPLASAARGITRIGLEADHATWSLQRRLAHDTLSWAHLVPTEGLVLGLRAVKDDGEIARLESAAAIADDALAAVRDQLSGGITEVAFARVLEAAMVERGASGPSFETIVASGPNGAKPHARPSERVVGASGEGELVVIDFGALVDGYHSDMTRTLAVGQLSDTQERMLEVVHRAQAAGVATVRAGTRCADVDARCREVIAEAGWADAFSHGTGHGIGLVIHEEPRVSSRSDQALVPGHCITVEPGVYLPEHGGVRVEDSVVVTSTGCRPLTNAPYDR